MAHDAYITSSDYTAYKGRAIAVADFDRIALRASEEIDALTANKIRLNGGLATFTAADQERIKLATSAVAEWLAIKEEAEGGTGVMPTSEKIGSYSYTIDQTGIKAARKEAYTRAGDFLLYTGLLYRGVDSL